MTDSTRWQVGDQLASQPQVRPTGEQKKAAASVFRTRATQIRKVHVDECGNWYHLRCINEPDSKVNLHMRTSHAGGRAAAVGEDSTTQSWCGRREPFLLPFCC